MSSLNHLEVIDFKDGKYMYVSIERFIHRKLLMRNGIQTEIGIEMLHRV